MDKISAKPGEREREREMMMMMMREVCMDCGNAYKM